MLKQQAGTTAAASDLATRFGGRTSRIFSALGGFSIKMNESQAHRLAADPSVAYVEQNSMAHVADTQQNPTWGLDRIDQKNLPLDSKYTYPNNGSGATVYIADTGAYFSHPDYGGRVKSGYDFIDNDADATDCQGHGTHVAGTVASSTYGVAKGTSVVAVRVLDCQGSGPWDTVIAGIDWVVKNAKKPAVLSMSLGGTPGQPVSTVDDAVRRAVAAGITTTIAAGNSGADACTVSPSRTPEAITVAATDQSDNRAVWNGQSVSSNWGSCVDIFAPGTSITSTKNGGGTTQMSGTSMATPHVAGVVALYLTANPNASPADVARALTDNATPGLVKDPKGSPNKLLYTGFIGGGGNPTCGAKSNSTKLDIPDAGAAVTSEIQVSGCDGKASASLPVKVDIDHSYSGDLAISLIGPSGASYSLKKAGDLGSSAGVHTTYNVNASTENANGTWKLSIQDIYRYDAGSLTSWAITF
jgi:subtilisin family serine protease